MVFSKIDFSELHFPKLSAPLILKTTTQPITLGSGSGKEGNKKKKKNSRPYSPPREDGQISTLPSCALSLEICTCIPPCLDNNSAHYNGIDPKVSCIDQ